MNSSKHSKQNEAQEINDARKPYNIKQLPIELIAEIFFKLPITTLFHCKYVCKSWRVLFSNPNFTRELFSRTLNWLLIHVCNRLFGDKFFLVDIDIRSPSEPKLALELPRDPNFVHLGAQIKGSCNGLLLRKDLSYPYLGRYCISNPMTGECLPLPECYIKPSVVGFGFSSVSHVYKVVFMQPKKGEGWVMTVGSKTWRRLDIHNFKGAPPQHMIYLNGFLHGIVCSSQNGTMSSLQQYLNRLNGLSASTRSLCGFDVENEQFQQLPAPSTLEGDQSSTHWNLKVMRGCLSLFVRDSDGVNMYCWVMNDYGVKESWTKDFQIRERSVPRVLMFSTEEEQVLALENGQLRFFSVRQGRWRRLVVSNEVDGIPREINNAFFYTPNFTLINDMIKS
ncbi:hypothetical protein ACLB2K_021934 [Fragaria x ananassa]